MGRFTKRWRSSLSNFWRQSYKPHQGCQLRQVQPRRHVPTQYMIVILVPFVRLNVMRWCMRRYDLNTMSPPAFRNLPSFSWRWRGNDVLESSSAGRAEPWLCAALEEHEFTQVLLFLECDTDNIHRALEPCNVAEQYRMIRTNLYSQWFRCSRFCGQVPTNI